MSTLPNQSYVAPGNPLYLPATTVVPNIVKGVTLLSTITTSVVVSVPGLVSTSVVVASYVHPGGGGGAQYFQAITEGTNQVNFGLGVNSASGEVIQWHAYV